MENWKPLSLSSPPWTARILIAVAQKRLAEAEAGGFDGVVQENTQWWNAFYDQRENGRVFHGTTGTACTDNIRNIYHSYTDSHGGGTKTDMRQFECSASYAMPERDFQDFDSAPCYNEIFYHVPLCPQLGGQRGHVETNRLSIGMPPRAGKRAGQI